eukprot:TRINITY_DN21843_c0_g2_i3.p1 TRINITY_DN21843_c0_g2~~TRINITY_DN21843_c0_g2_i3.p1  ORF type:complete len:393 (-),score=56.44 TRINITY_DN21843_c0_g2_i3:324-1502(-)
MLWSTRSRYGASSSAAGVSATPPPPSPARPSPRQLREGGPSLARPSTPGVGGGGGGGSASASMAARSSGGFGAQTPSSPAMPSRNFTDMPEDLLPNFRTRWPRLEVSPADLSAMNQWYYALEPQMAQALSDPACSYRWLDPWAQPSRECGSRSGVAELQKQYTFADFKREWDFQDDSAFEQWRQERSRGQKENFVFGTNGSLRQGTGSRAPCLPRRRVLSRSDEATTISSAVSLSSLGGTGASASSLSRGLPSASTPGMPTATVIPPPSGAGAASSAARRDPSPEPSLSGRGRQIRPVASPSVPGRAASPAAGPLRKPSPRSAAHPSPMVRREASPEPSLSGRGRQNRPAASAPVPGRAPSPAAGSLKKPSPRTAPQPSPQAPQPRLCRSAR